MVASRPSGLQRKIVCNDLFLAAVYEQNAWYRHVTKFLVVRDVGTNLTRTCAHACSSGLARRLRMSVFLHAARWVAFGVNDPPARKTWAKGVKTQAMEATTCASTNR